VGLLLASLLGESGAVTVPAVGEPAPDFTLPSTTGEPISLSQFRGKQLVLLEFYGADFAPVWAANLSARKVDYEKFQALNVQILGISANHPFSQQTFADSLKLPFPLLSDFPELTVIRRYGLPSSSQTYAQRAFFLIDQQGIIRQRWLIGGGEDTIFSSDPLLEAARELAGKR
jgi:peroxiredoxin Q/BCP